MYFSWCTCVALSVGAQLVESTRQDAIGVGEPSSIVYFWRWHKQSGEGRWSVLHRHSIVVAESPFHSSTGVPQVSATYSILTQFEISGLTRKQIHATPELPSRPTNS